MSILLDGGVLMSAIQCSRTTTSPEFLAVHFYYFTLKLDQKTRAKKKSSKTAMQPPSRCPRRESNSRPSDHSILGIDHTETYETDVITAE
jgi:hypothetical protein